MIGKTEIKRDENGNITEIVHSDYAIDPSSFINPEAIKLFEALQKQFYIVLRDNAAGTKYHFQKVNGTKLNDFLFAFKDEKYVYGWSVTDCFSGLAIKTHLPTLKACKEFVAGLTEEQLAKIEAKRQEPKYQALCKELADFIVADTNALNQDFPDPKD